MRNAERVRNIALALTVSILAITLPVLPQQPDLERELEEAKALYREAKFAQAIAKLQSTIGRLEQLRDLEARKIQLADAYLHLALSYVALNDPTAAKETLKQMVRLDRGRRLDPEVYAPKVIELFEQAQAEVAAEPPAARAPPTVTAPRTEAKKKGSKLPYILIGAGGAAAGAVAAGSGGKETPIGTPSTPTASTTTTTTSIPATLEQRDIVLLSADPPPGSTIRLSQGGLLLTMRVRIVNDQSGTYTVDGATVHEGTPAQCLHGESATFTLTAGQPRDVNIQVFQPLPSQCPPGSSTTIGLASHLLTWPEHQVIFRRNFAAVYTIVP